MRSLTLLVTGTEARRRGISTLDARFLLFLFDAVQLVALAYWVGSVLFVSFALAPILFKVLEGPSAGRLVRALFPLYDMGNAYAAAIALAAVVCGRLTHPEYRGPTTGGLALLAVGGVLIVLYSSQSLTPAINAARDAGPEQKGRFDRLHRRSVLLNAASLMLGLTLLIAHAARPAPKTAGLMDLSPEETRERDFQVLEKRKAVFDARIGREFPEGPKAKPAP